MSRASEIIKLLKLEVHPEGGCFNEVFRSDLIIHSPRVRARRHAMTDIYFLLTDGQFSRFHRVHHDELWNFYEGSPLQLYDYDPTADVLHTIILGPLSDSNTYKYVVSADHWQAATPTGQYSLVGCTVAPGFDFRDFTLLKRNSSDCKRLLSSHPKLSKFV
ncbi:cupin domain-containing protein [candidate division KSB1 bacterium]|nr:cupin domain-containing protein [candidate division KSB1 bacterium]RQW00896.1 MAG: cupin domain-containing protein [candidate division KSB1 bacterium]